MAEIVQVESLERRYGDRLALAGVSFTAAAGECFGLLGPNGGGKTTLFRILTTLLPPSAGTASIAGHDVVSAREAVRAQIGVVFQHPSLDIHLTARENLLHAGHLYGLSGRTLAHRIHDNLSRMGVADRADHRVKVLSGGLRRRVELAMCTLHRPALLILDEPSSGLDPSARKDLWQQLDALRRSDGVTILLTTHDLDEADRCDRLGILDRGRLVALGTPDELKGCIGGDCITLSTDEPSELSRLVAERFACTAQVVAGAVRIEAPQGAPLVPQLVGAFGDRIRTVTMGRPTLEDVFVHQTGHRFEGDAA